MKKYPPIILAIGILVAVSVPTAALAADAVLPQDSVSFGTGTIYPLFAVSAS